MSAEKKEKDCFVIAPIGEEGSETRRRSDQVLKHIVKPAAEACGYHAARADEIDKPGLITSQVIQRVVGDTLVIADLTEMNPNVFYELAIRHSIRKPLVQIIEKGERIPFDVAGTRTIHVDHKDLDSVDTAKKEIIAQIRSLETSPEDIETPISVSLDLSNLRKSENPADRNLAELLAELSEIRAAISKVSDSQGSEVVAELRRMRTQFERVNDVPFANSTSRNQWRDLERISMVARHSELAGAEGVHAKAIVYASIAQSFAREIPWLHEGALEVFKKFCFGSKQSGEIAERKFAALAKSTLDSRYFREIYDKRGEEVHMALRIIERISRYSEPA